MRISGLSPLLPFLVLLGGCSPPPEEQQPPPGPPPRRWEEGEGVTGPDTVCDPRAPRPQVPELFVGPEQLEQRLGGYIDGAKRSIDLLMYELSRDSLIEKLIAAHRRGIAVRVVLDGKRGEDYENARRRLEAASVPVRPAPARFQYAHAKVMIIDRAEAVVMSANMDPFSMDRARNYGVVDRDPEDLVDLQRIFNADWAGAPDPDLRCTRLLVSPVNALDRMRALVNSAKKRLDFEVMYLAEKGMQEAVKERIRAGVAVRILLATPRFIEGNAEDAREFLAAGAQVKHFYNLHAKLVIADDAAFIGSENLSWTSLTQNREVGMLVTEAAPLGAAAAKFEEDWQKGVAPN